MQRRDRARNGSTAIAAIKRKMETKSKSKDEKHPIPARDQTTRKKETKPWFPSNPNSD
jgi:hypothetical protein